MKTSYKISMRIITLLSIMWIMQGCLKDMVDTTLTYTVYTPVYKTLQQIKEEIKTLPPKDIQFPNRIYFKDNYVLVSESYKGIHIINNANPASPQNVGFVDIPSNRDIAMKNNTLYADMFGDLLAIDVSDPKNAKLKNSVSNVFQDYPNYLPDSKIIVDYNKKDTVIHSRSSALPKKGEIWYYYDNGKWLTYSSNDGMNQSGPQGTASPSTPTYGTGGSMSRFTATKQRLFTVGNNNMAVFNITNDFNPSFVTRKPLPWGIETIFPFKEHLFVGSTTGVFIFSISDPDQPNQIGAFGHVRRCDPVVANDKYAFVTLRGGGACGGNTNQLDVLSLESLTSPTLIKSYALDNPFGLSIDNDLLFVCDGASGLKIFNAADVSNLVLKTTIRDIFPRDVIAMNGVAMVITDKGFYQYDYKDINNIKLLSKIEIRK